jgi:8-oxo-dGTP diphosphatase
MMRDPEGSRLPPETVDGAHSELVVTGDESGTRGIETVALIHLESRRVLLVRASGKGAYYMPGGKRDDGEDDAEALSRELAEELCVEMVRPSTRYYGTFRAQAYGKDDGVEVSIACYTAEIRGQPRPAAEISSFEFLTYEAYAAMEETAPAVLLILGDLRSRGLID